MSARATAALILVQVIHERRSLTTALPQGLATHTNVKEHPLIKELCFGVLRWYPRLQWTLKHFLRKPLKAKDADIEALLLLGLYQIDHLRIPPHAAVDLTVRACNVLKKTWAKSLCNAVLRQYLRDKEKLQRDTREAQLAHPTWLIDAIQQAWPQDFEAILAANNQRAPMHLRVNQRLVTRDDYLALLSQAGMAATASPFNVQGITLQQAVDVQLLPKFNEGFISVQDLAAQLAAPLLELKPGLKILDACAAPGGKTAHLLEVADQLEVVAVEIDAVRVQRIKENLQRLKLNAKIIHADVTDVSMWWESQPFDRILLDAPCSALGIIRRHPDLKLLRLPSDIPQLAKQQLHLLNAVWPLLKPDGILLYATCSVMPEENEQVIAAFLKAHPDAQVQVIEADWGIALAHGRQILPGMHDMDGFYYSRLVKK